MRGLAALLLSLAACTSGPTDSQRVAAAMEALRLVDPVDIEGRREATEKLARVDVDDPVARGARDACVAAYRASTELFGVIAELEEILKSGHAKEREDEARELFRRSGELQPRAEADLDRCNVELSKL